MNIQAFQAKREPTSGSGSVVVAIPSNDTTALVNPATGQAEIGIGFWADTAGTIAYVSADGRNADYKTVAAGEIVPVPISIIKNTGTTGGLTIHVIF